MGRYVGFKEYREIGKKRAVKEFVCESDNLVYDAGLYWELVKLLQERCHMI